MSIEQIVKEVASLPDQQRRQLIGQLIALGRSKAEDAEFRREMADRIDDQEPSHWLAFDELKRRLPTAPADE